MNVLDTGSQADMTSSGTWDGLGVIRFPNFCFVPVQVLFFIFFEKKNKISHVPDFIVDGKVIVELKAVSMLSSPHEVQLVNYLKATGFNIGLLINFGKSVVVKRRILS